MSFLCFSRQFWFISWLQLFKIIIIFLVSSWINIVINVFRSWILGLSWNLTFLSHCQKMGKCISCLNWFHQGSHYIWLCNFLDHLDAVQLLHSSRHKTAGVQRNFLHDPFSCWKSEFLVQMEMSLVSWMIHHPIGWTLAVFPLSQISIQILLGLKLFH